MAIPEGLTCPDCGQPLNETTRHEFVGRPDDFAHHSWACKPRLVATRARGAMDQRLERLLRQYKPGELVRAIETIVYGTGEEIPEGTLGHVQKTNVHGCSPLVTVAWQGIDPVLHAVSVESLEPARS